MGSLIPLENKAVYTTAPVADGWAGAVMIWAGAVMIWAGAVMIWAGAVIIWAGACSNTNFSTLKMPKHAKKAKCDGPTDRQTDGPTRWLIGRVSATKKSNDSKHEI